MSFHRALTLLGCFALLSACSTDEDNPFSWGGSAGTGGGVNLEGDTSTDDTPIDSGDSAVIEETGDPEDTGAYEVPEGELDEPGDYTGGMPEDGQLEINLEDVSGDSNTDQEFYLLLVNTGDSAASYELGFVPTDSSGERSGARTRAAAPAAEPEGLSPFREQLRRARASGEAKPYQPPAGPPPPLSTSDIGVKQDDFRVRNNPDDEESVEYITATLWAVGDSVAIWVDDDHPIDWDYDCDGTIDQPDANGSAYGFDNCDLQTIADIVDANILPNLTGYFGDVSDVNNDGLVSIVVTPTLNKMSLESSDENVQSRVIGSYADPEVDLTERSEKNPNSNEQEVIFVFAPDPYGFYNIYDQTTIDEYTDVAVAAKIARSLYQLISYNQHVLVSEGELEETWVREGLSLLASDLTGFGSVVYNDIWDYLDANHLSGLTDAKDTGAITAESYAAQYLFFRWIVDVAGTDVLSALVQTDEIGVDNIEATLGDYISTASGEMTMEEVVLMWQVALLTTNVTTSDGDALIDTSAYPSYADATSISAPTENPASGDLYGANGYQTGVNIRGMNYYYEDGATSSPRENEENRVQLSNTDFFNHVFGQEFFGYIEGSYAAQVVRLANLPYDTTTLELTADSDDLLALVIRIEDPDDPDYIVEVSPSATSVSLISMPALPTDGSPIYGIGEISGVGYTVAVAPNGDTSTVNVSDTDLWMIDLTDRVSGELVDIAVWLDRRYGETAGDIPLTDPWMAVVPAAYIPTPTVSATNSNSCTDGETFAYPAKMLEHLYYQMFLSSSSFSNAGGEDSGTTDTGSTSTEDFDPCGEVEVDATSCDVDWDRDGVLDANEPEPTNFLNQIHVMQCTLADGDVDAFEAVSSEIIDNDERDSDSEASYNRALNLGGNSADSGEGAYFRTTLTGGSQYVFVVSGGNDTGAYELTFKQVDE